MVAAGALALVGAALACAPKLPAPPYTEQPTSALAEIPYPPPPARAESVPGAPRGGAVWIDGEWVWRARRWSWKPGRWVVPPPGARFSPWTTVRDRTGTLFMASGVWRDAHGAAVEEPAALAVGVPGAGAIVSSEGDRVEQGPLAPLDAGIPPAGLGLEGDAGLAPEDDRARMPDASTEAEEP